MDTQNGIASALQLQRTVSALTQAIQDKLEQDLTSTGDTELWSAMAFSYSTLLALYEHHSHLCAGSNSFIGHDQLRDPALEGLRTTTENVAKFSRSLRRWLKPGRIPAASLLVCECLFSAGTSCVWYIGESGDQDAVAILADLQSTLAVLAHRWRISQSMLDVLDWEQKHLTLAGS